MRDQWTVTGSSSANSEKEHIKAAPNPDRQYLVTGYIAIIITADVTGDTIVTIEDEDDNVLWTDYFGDAAVRGQRLGKVWAEGRGVPIPAGKGCKLVTGAGGTACVIVGNLAGEEY